MIAGGSEDSHNTYILPVYDEKEAGGSTAWFVTQPGMTTKI